MNYGTNAGAGRIEKERIVDECDRAAQVVGAAKLGGGRPTLDQINGRLQQFIMSMSDQMAGIAGHLENHADLLYGPPPLEQDDRPRNDVPVPHYGGGHFAFTLETLDQLEKTFAERMQRLAFAAGRNCTLA